jgi:hypothetical protein
VKWNYPLGNGLVSSTFLPSKVCWANHQALGKTLAVSLASAKGRLSDAYALHLPWLPGNYWIIRALAPCGGRVVRIKLFSLPGEISPMKLRLQSKSIRLRLKRAEVEHLVKTGCVEEKIVFGSGAGDSFTYVLEASPSVSAPQAHLIKNGILVQVPAESASRWAASDVVGIEAILTVGDGERLQVLVEKDFACLNGSEEQNVDTFPNPLAGTKC